MTRKLHRGRAPFHALKELAERGPTELPEFRGLLRSVLPHGSHRDAPSRLMEHLQSSGHIKVKVWLTPEGLAALREADEREGARP